MGLDFAIDALYSTGWSGLDTAGCGQHADGRAYPQPDRVREEFRALGADLTLRHVDGFECFRAEWTGADQTPRWVVGTTEAEAAIYALAQFRRQALAPV